uniref:Uncharacterized protein n=1 Tax=Aegilops tauschii subsp. strangulata TaxID=200361 RepID=A0A453SJE2_AEGTS
MSKSNVAMVPLNLPWSLQRRKFAMLQKKERKFTMVLKIGNCHAPKIAFAMIHTLSLPWSGKNGHGHDLLHGVARRDAGDGIQGEDERRRRMDAEEGNRRRRGSSSVDPAAAPLHRRRRRHSSPCSSSPAAHGHSPAAAPLHRRRRCHSSPCSGSSPPRLLHRGSSQPQPNPAAAPPARSERAFPPPPRLPSPSAGSTSYSPPLRASARHHSGPPLAVARGLRPPLLGAHARHRQGPPPASARGLRPPPPGASARLRSGLPSAAARAILCVVCG